MKKATLSTIAKLAGVSKPVVYTVLNNREGTSVRVGPQTKKKVLEISRKLGYVIPKGARELFSGRSNNIGIILQQTVPPYMEFVSYFQQEARRRNLEITPYITNSDDSLEEHYLNSARDGRVDAMMIISTLEGSFKRYQRFAKPPYNLKILYYGEPYIPGIPSIHFDATEAGRLAAEHLAEIGCRKPAFFGAMKNTAREKGFVEYFQKKGLPVPLSVFTSRKVQEHSFPESQEFAREFLKLKHLPDGVFVAYDSLDAALIVEAVKKGVRVPEDIKILSCGNWEFCLYTTPPLTSIDVNIPLMAKKSLEKIVDMIEGKSINPLHTITPVSLMVRESTQKERR